MAIPVADANLLVSLWPILVLNYKVAKVSLQLTCLHNAFGHTSRLFKERNKKKIRIEKVSVFPISPVFI